jgi:hypothetical protein
MKKKYPNDEVKRIRDIRVSRPSIIPTVEICRTLKTNHREGLDRGFNPKTSKRG